MIRIIIVLLISSAYAVYDIGDIVSNSDQNVELSICDETSEYSLGEIVKLSDWNGNLNGGDYHVIWLELSASW